MKMPKGEINKEFPQESELKEKSKRLDEVNSLLNMYEKINEVLDSGKKEPEEMIDEKDIPCR